MVRFSRWWVQRSRSHKRSSEEAYCSTVCRRSSVDLLEKQCLFYWFYCLPLSLRLLSSCVRMNVVVELPQDQTSRERVIQSLASMSSSQIVSATALHHKSVKSASSSSSSSAHAAAAAGTNARTTLDTLRHANYHNHNGFTAATVLSPSQTACSKFLFFVKLALSIKCVGLAHL